MLFFPAQLASCFIAPLSLSFAQSTDGSETLLPAISTRSNTNPENVEALNRIHSVRERRVLKQLQPTESVPSLGGKRCHADNDYKPGVGSLCVY